ncbi:MAG: lysophospholipid acyltransferase family protein [Pseudomonadota bacterium]
MMWLRLVWRGTAGLLWTVGCVAVMALIRYLPGQATDARWRRLQRAFGLWARGLLRVLNVSLTVRGTPPTTPGLLISNHLGYLDIVVLAATVRATFVSKSEVARWPGIGPAVTLLGTIYVDRSRRRDVARVNKLIAESLERGRSVIVFAEGTSSNGDDILPLRPSLLDVAEDGHYPVHYARLDFQTPPGAPDAGEAVCWWGDAPFLPHLLGLLQVPSVQALVHFGDETVPVADRKTLALTLREKIRALPALEA